MAKQLTADDLLPLVAALAPGERGRLLRLLSGEADNDAVTYSTHRPAPEEFSSDEEPLSWEADGWEEFR